jgi:integrase/recombinase XerD
MHRFIRIPKRRNRKIPRHLTIPELKRVLEEAYLKGGSTRIAVGLALYAGLRVSEVAALRVQDVLRTHEPGRHPKYTVFVANGKGSKSRSVHVPSKWGRVFVAYAEKQRTAGHAWMFPSSRDRAKHMSAGCVACLSKSVFRSVGLPAYSSHALRHAFCTRSLEGGANVVSVSKSMGHASLASTTAYAHDVGDKAPASYFVV